MSVKLSIFKTLRFRLFLLVSGLLISTISAHAAYNAWTFYESLLLAARERAVSAATTGAAGAGAVIDSWMGQLLLAANALNGSDRDRYQAFLQNFVTANPDFVSIEVFEAADGGPAALKPIAQAVTGGADTARFGGAPVKPALAAIRKAARTSVIAAVAARDADRQRLQIENLAPQLKLPVLTLVAGFKVAGSQGTVWAALTAWQTKLQESLASTGAENLVLVDAGFRLVSASDSAKLGFHDAAVTHPLRRLVEGSQAAAGFREWEAPNRRRVMGSFTRLPRYGLSILSVSDSSAAYRAVVEIVIQTTIGALILILVAVTASYAASSGITRNLQLVTAATMRIAKGEFNTKVPIKSQDEVGLLGTVVNYMGGQLAGMMDERVEKARLDTEVKTAKTVQEAFFPENRLTAGKLDVAAFFQPASECGGDWWGYHDLGGGRHLICIADATGHGVPAALVTAMVFAGTATLAQAGVGVSPARLLTELNRTLCLSRGKTNTMTFFAAVIDLEASTLTYANASHNFPLILSRQRAIAEGAPHITRKDRKELTSTGNPLGLDAGLEYGERTVKIKPNDRILFYTDGLFECRNVKNQQWGKRAMYKQIERTALADQVVFRNSLVKAAFSHFGKRPTDDDITFVVVDIGEIGGEATVPVETQEETPAA